MHKRVPRLGRLEALCSSIERVRRRVSEWMGRPRLLAIAAGEAVKLALYASGYLGHGASRGC